MTRCTFHRGHLLDWVRDEYTTARYRCRHCKQERGVWKKRVPEFEKKNAAAIGKRRPTT